MGFGLTLDTNIHNKFAFIQRVIVRDKLAPGRYLTILKRPDVAKESREVFRPLTTYWFSCIELV